MLMFEGISKTSIASLAAGLCLTATCLDFAVAADAVPATVPDLTRSEAISLIGVNFGEQLRRLGFTDPAALKSFQHGLVDGVEGRRTTAEEQQRLAHFFYASTKAAIASNLNNAHQFLQRNSSEKDVRTTSSGLQYIVLAAGDPMAASPTLGDQVTVRYRGTLLDGTEFCSFRRNLRTAARSAVTFPADRC